MMRVWMAPAGLHVEPARPEDTRSLADIHKQCFARGWAASEFSAYVDDPATALVLVACDGGRRVAGFAAFRMAAGEAELLSLAVQRRWRGRGVGTALMKAAHQDLRDSAVQHMFLEVEEGNVPALALYRSSGFVEIGRRAAYYPKPDGKVAAALVMRADIA